MTDLDEIIDGMSEAERDAIISLNLCGQRGFAAGCNMASYLHWENADGESICLGEDADALLRLGILTASKEENDKELPEPIFKDGMEFQADHWVLFSPLGKSVRARIIERKYHG